MELRSGTELPAAFLVRAEAGKPPLGGLGSSSALVLHLGLQAAVQHFRATERAGGEGSGCTVVQELTGIIMAFIELSVGSGL